MEILRFIAWWWDRVNTAIKPLLIVLCFFLLAVLSGVTFGTKGLLIFLATILSILVLALVYVFIRLVHQRYEQYKEYRDAEAGRIVQRLKGEI